MGFVIFLIIVALIVVLSGIRIINQYERGIVLTLGKYSSSRNPGLNIIIPGIQRLIKVDVRSTPIDVPKQEIITKDNVTVGIDAVVYLRVLDAAKAVLETTNYIYATSQFAQAALRDVTGNADLDEILGSRELISEKIKAIGVGDLSAGCKFTSSTYGMIIGIYRAIPQLDYARVGIDRNLFKTDATDFPIPELDSVGMQTQYRCELSAPLS